MIDWCNDFDSEILQFAKIGRMVGLDVRNSPRTHAEIAGEAIEYYWVRVLSKNEHRRYPTKKKRGRANFIESMAKSFGAMTIEIARKNTRHQKGYIKAYAILDGNMDANNIPGGISPAYLKRDDIQQILNGHGEVTFNKIENMVKVLKTHWSVEQSDTSGCAKTMKVYYISMS